MFKKKWSRQVESLYFLEVKPILRYEVYASFDLNIFFIYPFFFDINIFFLGLGDPDSEGYLRKLDEAPVGFLTFGLAFNQEYTKILRYGIFCKKNIT